MLPTRVATETTRGRQIKTLKKVILWRILSIALTYSVTYAYTGDVKSATGFTAILHLVLMASNYMFEIYWENTTGSQKE